jgi:hypothetical protein
MTLYAHRPESEVIVVCFNAGHAELGLNLFVSLQQAGVRGRVAVQLYARVSRGGGN